MHLPAMAVGLVRRLVDRRRRLLLDLLLLLLRELLLGELLLGGLLEPASRVRADGHRAEAVVGHLRHGAGARRVGAVGHHVAGEVGLLLLLLRRLAALRGRRAAVARRVAALSAELGVVEGLRLCGRGVRGRRALGRRRLLEGHLRLAGRGVAVLLDHRDLLALRLLVLLLAEEEPDSEGDQGDDRQAADDAAHNGTDGGRG